MEHFCTLFDHKFLPAGLCLHESLLRYDPNAHLWILCLDDAALTQLRALGLPNVTLIPLADLENDRLRSVKPTRTVGEYCWTLTPFLPGYVLAKDRSVSRVTYLDADLFFFRAPSLLLDEFGAAHALITEHAYDPAYDQSATSGRFCVQFVTFRQSKEARAILEWWQERCLEWCYARHEDGKFGDQMYLDQWPSLFGSAVHILAKKSLALAPWNASYFLAREPEGFRPAFFHFHGLRVISPRVARLFSGYRVGARAMPLYEEYVAALARAAARVKALGAATPYFAEPSGPRAWLRNLRYLATGRTATAKLD